MKKVLFTRSIVMFLACGLSVVKGSDGTADEVTTLNMPSKMDFVDRTKMVVRGEVKYAIPDRLNDGLEVADARNYGDLSDIYSFLNEIEARNQNFRKGINVELKQMKDGRKQPIGTIDSVLIAKDGKLIIEEYFADAKVDKPHYQMSITKSITAHCIGKAIELGMIKSVDDLILDYLPEVDRTKIAKGCDTLTLKDLLTMSSGIRAKKSKGKIQVTKDNYVQLYLSLTGAITPQLKAKYKYDGTNPEILGKILYNVSGLTMEQFAKKYYFDPLGITKFRFDTSSCGLTKTAAGMRLRSRDMLKIGLMNNAGGRWNGKQIINSQWVSEALKAHVNQNQPSHYGYQWWTQEHSINGVEYSVRSARGAGGQFIFMIPELEIVGVFTSYYANNKPIQYFPDIFARTLCKSK